MNDDLLRGKILSSKYLFRKPWLTVRSECLEMPNGKIVPEYFVHEYPEWVNVIAVTNDRKIVMIRQYRHALGRISFEIPAGVCENNDISLDESARRELLEETGYSGGRWQKFMSLSPNPATNTNMAHTFLAIGVEKISSQHLDETECIEVIPSGFDEVLSMLENGEIIQALMAAPLWKFFNDLQNGNINI